MQSNKEESNQGTSTEVFHTNLQSTSNTSPNSIRQSHNYHGVSSTLLGTAIVHNCHMGITSVGRVLIDPTSEASFISDRLTTPKTNAKILELTD